MFGRLHNALVAGAWAVCLGILAAGCGRGEKVAAPVRTPGEELAAHRAETAEIHAVLADVRLAQKGRAVAERRLAAVRAEARAALGGQATEGQVLAEIAAHGAKYPDWARARADLAECEKRIAAGRARGLADVRARLLKRQAGTRQKAAPAK